MAKKDADTGSPFRGVYFPEYIQDDKDVLRKVGRAFTQIKREETQEAMGLTELVSRFANGEDLRPLTIPEAELVDKSVGEMQETVKRVKSKMKWLNDEIDGNVGASSDATFDFKFKHKARLKKALQVVTGKIANKITYADYKFALDLKKSLEEEDVGSFFEEDEDEE
jgi:hypothetical protein